MEILQVPYPEIPEDGFFFDKAMDIIAGNDDELYHIFTGKKRV